MNTWQDQAEHGHLDDQFDISTSRHGVIIGVNYWHEDSALFLTALDIEDLLEQVNQHRERYAKALEDES